MQNMNMTTETIAAIASGLTCSGISVIRISGAEAFLIADKIFKSASGRTVQDMKSFTFAYGHITDDNGRVIDEVLLLKMKGPHSYTREDVVEIDCHGGIVVTQAVLETIIAAGARPAEPGEFTKRAFLNGRIDLSQAEAVSDIIAAKSSLALKNSINQLRGNVREKIGSLRDRLLSKTAFIEAALDDPEHYTLDGFDVELQAEVSSVLEEINVLINSSDNGRIIKEGINTVILGRPNAGKSSLLNLILGEERAIVTDIAGTTRDTLEESVIMDGLILNITDTAGIRDTDNIIEQLGVDKAKRAAAEADLILYLVDATEGVTKEDRLIFDEIRGKRVILLINKTDVEQNPDVSDFLNELGINADNGTDAENDAGVSKGTDAENDTGVNKHTDADNGNSESTAGSEYPLIRISSKTGEGMTELKQCIRNLFFKGRLDINDEIYITNLRQKKLLSDAAESLKNVLAGIDMGMPQDFYSIDLMAAYTSLGLITGDDVEDDLADRIFSEFCMGK